MTAWEPGSGIGPYVPLPEQPPESAPGARPRHLLSRRRFLALGAGVAATGVLGVTVGPRVYDDLAGTQTVTAGGPAKSSSSRRRLVLVTLYGGNDGLNTVVPCQDAAYASARGPLALAPDTILPLTDGFGFHPSLTDMKQLWDQGHLAIVHGVGFADPNYSHFESMDIWQSGVPEDPVTTGWLGRWLDGTKSTPLRAVAIGPTVPTALSGERVQGVAIAPGPITLPGDTKEQSLFGSLSATAAHRSALGAAVVGSGAALLEVDRTLGPILDKDTVEDPAAASAALAIANGGGGRSAGNVLTTQLSIVAHLILGGAEADVYSVALGGFDTHSDQEPTQQALLTEVDTALPSFLHSLAGHPAAAETVVLVYTEFGRRVAGNASAGSDHGWANVAFVAGQPVKGGFYGEPPSLTNLSEGNQIYTTDFRSLYATAFDQVLGVDPQPFLGVKVPTLPLL